MKLPLRYGLHVFVNDAGTISIVQTDDRPSADEHSVVKVHPVDVVQLIRFLHDAKVLAQGPAEPENF